MTHQQLEQQIRFADQLATSYFATLTRLRASGRRAVFGGMAYREDSLQSAIGEASSLADSLIDATKQAKTTAMGAGINGVPRLAEPFDPPVLDDEQYTLIRLEEAQNARSEIRSLQAGLPHIDWSISADAIDAVDLFASKKKTAFIVGGSIAVAAITLAFFYPMPAFIVGMLAVFVLGKPIMRELIWRRS